MVTIYYSPEFQRDYKKLSSDMRVILKERGRLFEERPFHPLLKTHKLSGHLKHIWAFSVDYRHRVLFEFISANEIQLLRVGDHSIYRKMRV